MLGRDAAPLRSGAQSGLLLHPNGRPPTVTAAASPPPLRTECEGNTGGPAPFRECPHLRDSWPLSCLATRHSPILSPFWGDVGSPTWCLPEGRGASGRPVRYASPASFWQSPYASDREGFKRPSSLWDRPPRRNTGPSHSSSEHRSPAGVDVGSSHHQSKKRGSRGHTHTLTVAPSGKSPPCGGGSSCQCAGRVSQASGWLCQ